MIVWQRSYFNRCNSLSALARRTVKHKNRFISIAGPCMRQSSGSPPGFSRATTLGSLYGDRASGTTARVACSLARNEYSCSIFSMLSSSGRIETGAGRRTGAASDCLERPAYRRNHVSRQLNDACSLWLHKTPLLAFGSPSPAVLTIRPIAQARAAHLLCALVNIILICS